MARLRAGIVGTGGIARAHADAIRAHSDRVDLVAATDIDPARLDAFCAEWEVPARFPTLAAMLEAGGLDLVHLCSPPGAHLEGALACLAADVTVWGEKPPCLTLAEVDRISAAEQRSAAHFVGVFQHRFSTPARAARRAIESSAFGRPLLAICHTLWYRDDAYYAADWRGRWDTEGGGPTMGQGIHQIDLLGHLLGEWTSVSAQALRLARTVETEDLSLAHVTFDNGAVASVVNSVLSPREQTYLRIDFTEGTLEVEHPSDRGLDGWTYSGPDGTWPPTGPYSAGSHRTQLGEILSCLERGERPAATGSSLRRTMELITGIYAAAFGKSPVSRADLRPGHPFYQRLDGGGDARAGRA